MITAGAFKLQKVKRISIRKEARQKRQESYVNPIEWARNYRQVMKEEGLNQTQLATKLGITRVRVNQYLALLKLPKGQQESILKKGKKQLITERALRHQIKF